VEVKRGNSHRYFRLWICLEGRNTLRDAGNRELLLKKQTYICGDGGPDSGFIAPARAPAPSRGSANEADDGEERLNGLHCDDERLYSTVTRVV
jgi:hypothetical protein